MFQSKRQWCSYKLIEYNIVDMGKANIITYISTQ